MELNTQPGIGIKPLLSLRRHGRLGLIAGALVFFLGLPLVWIKGQPTYVAESVFQVSPRYMKNLQSDSEVELQSNSQYREYVNHLSNTVTRYDVLQRALADLKARGIDERPPALSEREYIERLQKTVYVRAILDTYMVRIGLEGGRTDKSHLHDLVNALMAAFLETTKAEQIYGSSERLNVLGDNAAKLRAEIADMEAQRVALSEKLGLTTFTENATNPYDVLLSQAREKMAQAEIERTRAEAAHKAFLNQKEIPGELGRSLLEIRLQDAGLQVMRTEVTRRVEQLNQSIVGLEEKHPARGPALVEIKTLTQRLQAREDEFDRQVYENARLRLVASLNQKLQVEKEMRQSLNELEGQSADFARVFQKSVFLSKEIRDREQRLKQIQDRLSYLDTERNALGFVRLVTPALPADQPKGPGKLRLLLLLTVAAFGTVLVIPVALDMLDRRIRSVNDAEKLMGIPAAGWQIRVEDLPTEMFSVEQTRRFVSTLIRLRSRSQRRCFAFTSVKSGGGATRTILDTAGTLESLGATVLVIEANAFAPFAGFDALQPGLTDCLAGHAPASALPRRYAHNGTPIAVVGIGGERNSGLQRLDLLKAAIAQWQDKYDYLLIDLPPLLLSADAEMLIETIGQVFLIVEAEAVTRGEVSRAKRLLQKIDPEAVGLFVNAIPLFRGSGYMEEVIIETLTRGKLSRFMSLAHWRLQWELMRTRWSLHRHPQNKVRSAPAAMFAEAASSTQDKQTLIALNDQGVLAARRGDLEQAARLLTQVAESMPTRQFLLNASKALCALMRVRGWDEQGAAKVRHYLQQARHLAPTCPEVRAACQAYGALSRQRSQ